MFRVFKTSNNAFRAVQVGTPPDMQNITNSFESPYWDSFQRELLRRLTDGEETETIQDLPPSETRRKGDA